MGCPRSDVVGPCASRSFFAPPFFYLENFESNSAPPPIYIRHLRRSRVTKNNKICTAEHSIRPRPVRHSKPLFGTGLGPLLGFFFFPFSFGFRVWSTQSRASRKNVYPIRPPREQMLTAAAGSRQSCFDWTRKEGGSVAE